MAGNPFDVQEIETSQLNGIAMTEDGKLAIILSITLPILVFLIVGLAVGLNVRSRTTPVVASSASI